jgi:hypothetical protein
MKRRSAAAWVENNIMGELVPPELDYLIDRLKLINPAADTRLVIEHARKIHTAYQLLRGRPDDHGFKIKGKKRRRAEAVAAPRGLKDDLQRLLKVARAGSAREWETAWLGVSGQARSLVSPPAPPIIERQFDEKGSLAGFRRASPAARQTKMVVTSRFSSVVPSPQESLPRIEAALSNREFSSKRQTDKLTYIFVLRVRDAYFALTGKKGLTYRPLVDDSTLNPKGGFVEAGLVTLAKDIDRQLGTRAITVSRLRKKEADMGLSSAELTQLRKPWGTRTS